MQLRASLLGKMTVAFLVSWATSAAAEAAAGSTPRPFLDDLIVALIALGGVGLSAGIAYVTAKNTSISEQRKRQSELALKISEMVSSQDAHVKLTAMRRFAVGLVKIEEPSDHREYGIVHFIPMNSRVTVGRHQDNDITLTDKENSLSRWHCGFVSDQRSVWLEDYRSVNGTMVNTKKISYATALNTGDKIALGPFVLYFVKARPNQILDS